MIDMIVMTAAMHHAIHLVAIGLMTGGGTTIGLLPGEMMRALTRHAMIEAVEAVGIVVVAVVIMIVLVAAPEEWTDTPMEVVTAVTEGRENAVGHQYVRENPHQILQTWFLFLSGNGDKPCGT
jgi:hypothetical protein